ncbi:hypothetical protein F5B20DRAFT_93015 [Whalleya microplaca]|nr:hypothetical protein F5B20DRAFT_93015 [Whalleya microplaca]
MMSALVLSYLYLTSWLDAFKIDREHMTPRDTKRLGRTLFSLHIPQYYVDNWASPQHVGSTSNLSNFEIFLKRAAKHTITPI